MKATLFDCGAGNLHSLVRALAAVGVDAKVEVDPLACARAEGLLVLPGVGAFGLAAERMAAGRQALRQQLEQGRPCLGICLGMQLLFDRSEEGTGEGLGFIAGPVTRLRTRRVPHIGWTAVDGLEEMYFAHSFACRPTDASVVTAWAQHGDDRVAAMVKKQRAVGVQFHPEKSSTAGLTLLRKLVTEVTS
jgi:imidazole glycerol-phosphate synthase subunit HisH